MSLLGDWIAKIIIDHSGIAPALSSSEKRWDEYYKYIEQRDRKNFTIIKKSLEDITGIRVSTTEEAKAQISSLERIERKAVDARVRDLSRAEAAYEKQLKLVSDLRTKLLQYASIAITIPVTFLAKKTIEDFIEFQQAMQNIRAVIGATNDDMIILTGTAIQLSEKFATSPTKIAKAMFELGQAGLDAIEIYNTVGPVLQLSAAGMKDVAFTANLVTTTLQAFQKGSEEASNVADIFASSNAKSVSSLDKLNASLKYTAGLWSSMGWTLEDLVGTLDTLYDTGVRGEKAGRLLASAINGLQKPSRSASKAIEGLLGYTEALSPQYNDITQIIRKLSDANADASDVVKIFGKESAEVINRLVQNYSKLGENIAEVSNQTGETAKQASTQLDTLGKRAETLRVVFGNISKETTGVFSPAMKDVVNSLINFGKNISKLPPWIKAFVASFSLIAAVSPAIILAFTKISAAMAVTNAAGIALGATIAASIGPIAIVAAGLGGLAATYAVARKYQEDWEKSVVSSVNDLSRSGKSIDSLTRSINDLYQSGKDTAALARGLDDLANVFPRLRDQLNKNASDTASAMRVLNEEYARLKTLQSEIAKNTTLGESASKLEESILLSKNRIAELEAELAKLKSSNYFQEIKKNLDIIGKSGFADTFEKFAFNLRNGYISTQDIIDATSGGGTFIDWVDRVSRISFEIQDARLNLSRLASGKYSVKIDNIDKDLSTLEKIVKIFESIENTVITTKFKLLLENKGVEQSAREIAESISAAIGDSLSGIVIGDKLDMQRLGILPKSGEITGYYQKEYNNMFEKIKKDMRENGKDWWEAFKSSFGDENKQLSFSGSFDKIRNDLISIQALQVEINSLQDSGDNKSISLLNDKSKALINLQNKYKNLFATEESGLSTEERGLRNAILALGVLGNEFSKNNKKQKENLDWWEQIIKNIRTASMLLSGKDIEGNSISSLNSKLSELRDGSGEAVEELRLLSEEIVNALSSNNEFSSIDQIKIAEAAFNSARLKVEEFYSSTLKMFGIEMPVDSFNNQRDSIISLLSIYKELIKNVEEGSENYNILSNAIDNLDYKLLELSGSFGSISDFDYSSAKFVHEFSKREESILSMQNAIESIDSSSLDNILYIIDNLDPESGIPELSNNVLDSEDAFSKLSVAIRQASVIEKELKNRIDNLKVSMASSKTETEKSRAELEKMEKALALISKKKNTAITLKINNIKDMVDSIGNVADSVDSMIDTFDDADSSIYDICKSIGSSVSSIGNAIGLLSPQVGGIVSIVGSAISTISSIFGIFGDDNNEKENYVYENVKDILKEAIYRVKGELAEEYRSVGNSLAEYINNGFSEGLALSSEKSITEFKKYMFNLISTALITASGFEDKVASIAEELWDNLSPSSARANEIESQLSNIMDQLGFNDTSISSVREAIKAVDDFFVAQSNALATGGDISETWKDLYATLENIGISDAFSATHGTQSLQAYKETLRSLLNEFDSIDITINPDALTGDALSEAEDAISEYSSIISDLADALGISSSIIEDSIEEIANSLEETLTRAVLTGSYSDFKSAVYNQIVTSITSAIVDSQIIRNRIQGLIESISNVGSGFSSSDANSILNEIRSIWSEVTDENTPLGSIMVGLRDALGDFGLLDINVNPGTVVTAIPSDVRDDLIEAIENSIDSLVNAITIAGLNSNIGTVNITTAYITSMAVEMVTIQQANLNLNGSMIFQLQSGQSLDEWLEGWMADYLARSAP